MISSNKLVSISTTFYEQLLSAKVYFQVFFWIYTFSRENTDIKAALKMLVKLIAGQAQCYFDILLVM
jgi:hypothetical protein